jgi:hypothetical protein
MRCAITLLLLVPAVAFLPQTKRSFVSSKAFTPIQSTQLHESSLDSISEDLYTAFQACQDDLAKTCKVKVAPVSTGRLGLVASDTISKGEVALAMPYDDRYVLSPSLAKKTVFKGILPEDFESWTGDAGLLALLVLNEVARAAGEGGVEQPQRPAALQKFMSSWYLLFQRIWIIPISGQMQIKKCYSSRRPTRFTSDWMMWRRTLPG